MFDSPAGAYTPDPSLAENANFGFFSRYKKGNPIPSGTTKFLFRTAVLNFRINRFHQLDLIGGNYAIFTGEGTINGSNSPAGLPFQIMVWVRNGKPDTLRIKVWWEDSDSEYVVYDNGMAQAIR
jgi:hypothetical protein